jgi:hypothetical protein
MSISRGAGLATFATLASTGMATFNGGLSFQGGSFAAGTISTDASWGCFIKGRSGSASDLVLADSAGGLKLQISPTGIGFLGTNPVAKRTGYGAPTGTATRATFATSTVTLPVLAEHVKALIDDLTAYGLIGT